MEYITSLPIKETIDKIVNGGKSLLNSRLVGLSNLTSTELEYLAQAWVTIEPKWQR
jgi:hypothetical protein